MMDLERIKESQRRIVKLKRLQLNLWKLMQFIECSLEKEKQEIEKAIKEGEENAK